MNRATVYKLLILLSFTFFAACKEKTVEVPQKAEVTPNAAVEAAQVNSAPENTPKLIQTMPVIYNTQHTSDALRRAKSSVLYPIVDRLSKQELSRWQSEEAFGYGLDTVVPIDSLGVNVVFIPQGRYFFGDSVGFGSTDELPVIDAMIDSGFGVMEHEVSYGLWRRCARAGRCSGGAAEGDGDDKMTLPVVNVSLQQIQQQFIPWMQDITGVGWKLPNEVLWEYFARGGSNENYPWGEQVSREASNYGARVCCSYKTLGADKWLYAAPVGSFPANAWGVKDVIGNVSEWTSSCYQTPLSVKVVDRCDDGQYVTRGGSWYHAPKDLRVSNRSPYLADTKLIYLGFRLIVSLGALQALTGVDQPQPQME